MYTFETLNDKDFEVLVCDLLSAHLTTRIERFKPGKDQGIDGRFFATDGRETIIQAKHYIKTGYPGLLRKLTREELPKIERLKPSNYMLATSLPLSPSNKREIRFLFRDFMPNDSYVFGQEDLNGLLSAHPQIEEGHFKLWITSTIVLEAILNRAIKGRSASALKHIQEHSHKYVPTTDHHRALTILKDRHVIIISGEPGVGKTTLAENLCLYYASRGFEFLAIAESLSEAEATYKSGCKQVFYFDDFLGSNYYEAVTNKKDSHIVAFAQRVLADNSKRFILTSRTNILNTGILHSPIFANQRLRKDEFLLTIQSLSTMDKARILYNHLWFSSLSNDYREEIYKDKRYRQIINHRNFNPRLIEFITDPSRLQEDAVAPQDYWPHIEATLSNPRDIWAQCFKIQNSPEVRDVVRLAVFNGIRISEPHLLAAFHRLRRRGGQPSPLHPQGDFNSVMQLATKSFLNRHIDGEKAWYDLFNPSIADYILREYCSDSQTVAETVIALESSGAIAKLHAMQRDKLMSAAILADVMEEVLRRALEDSEDIDFLMAVVSFFVEDRDKEDQIMVFFHTFAGAPQAISDLSCLVRIADAYYDKLQLSDYSFLEATLSSRYLNYEEIEDLAAFIESHDIADEALLEELRDNIELYLDDQMGSAGIDVGSHIRPVRGYEGDIDYSVDSDGVTAEMVGYLDGIVADFRCSLLRELDVDTYSIAGKHYDACVEGFFSSLRDDDSYEGPIGVLSVSSDVDDLFERG